MSKKPPNGKPPSSKPSRRRAEFDLTAGRAFSLSAWLALHVHCALSSLGRLATQPVATVVTVLAIAVALSLPLVLYIALDNAFRAVGGIERNAQITAFLRHDLDDSQTAAVASILGGWDAVKHADVISRDEALAEYQQMTGFGEIRDIFEGRNPMPNLIVITPRGGRSDRAELVALRDRVAAQTEVESVQLDLLWVDRLAAIVDTLRRIVQVLFAMLGLGILLIVGNTIRLGVESQREEIGIVRLFGATDAFIRRPFLYVGLWYGLSAGGLACLLVAVATGLAQAPVERLVALYASSFELAGLQPWSAIGTVGGGGLLGLGGAWIAVARELRKGSDPR